MTQGPGGVGGAGGNAYLYEELAKQDAKDQSQVDQVQGASKQEETAAAEAAAAQAAQAARLNASPTDSVSRTSDVNASLDAVGGAKPGDGAQPLMSDATVDMPPEEASTVASQVINDISSMFDRMEQAIDVEFAKLIRDCKNNIEDLEQKIKDMTKKIDELKALAVKIEKVAAKMEELLPKIIGMVGSDPPKFFCPEANQFTDREKAFADMLAKELKAAGVELEPQQLQSLVECMTRGGQGAMAVAMYISMSIAEGQADAEMNPNRGEKAPEDDALVAAAPEPTGPLLSDNVQKLDLAEESATDAAAEPVGVVAPENVLPERDPTRLGGTDGSAEAFQKKLEELSTFAADYAYGNPYAYEFSFTPDGRVGFTNTFDEANAALIHAVFPGLGTGPNNYKVTKDFATTAKNGVDIEGFSFSGKDMQAAAMMPGPMAAAFLTQRVNEQLASKLADIDRAIDGLRKEIEAAKNEIKSLQQEVGELEKRRDSEKAKLREQKQKALEEAQKMIAKMQEMEVQAQQRMLETLNDAVAGVFDATRQIIESDLSQKTALTAAAPGFMR
jgi:predicted  nucleic acid-binding Zn-ribbon protein